MVRPFGVWAPATTIAELQSRTPSWKDFRFIPIWRMRNEVYYSPETMAWFKNPQAFKDALDNLRAMKYTDKFLGDGFKYPNHWVAKVFGIVSIIASCNLFITWYFYNRSVPAHNPSWRKVMTKEWEEAINTSPWDHRTHVWNYSHIHAAHLGSAVNRGAKKFYIPA